MRRSRGFALSILIGTALIAPACAAPPSAGGTPPDEAGTRRALQAAEKARAEQTVRQRQAAETAAHAQVEEKRLESAGRDRTPDATAGDLKSALDEFDQLRAEARGQIEQDEALIDRLLAAAGRLSKFPRDAWVAAGAAPSDAGRGSAAMHEIARAASAGAKSLAKGREALDDAEREAARISPVLDGLDQARARAEDARAHALDDAHARREAAEQDAAAAAQSVAEEAARAAGLRATLRALEARRTAMEQKKISLLTAHSKPARQLSPPVKGTLLHAWGEPDNGERWAGQAWRTAPDAPVVAPCGGTVAFAEPFRGYGKMVILDCGGGYHAVLGGLDRIAVASGQTLHDGDPVGAMRPAEAAAGETQAKPAAAARDGDARPVLYFELRKGGKPTNPAPWLRAAGS